MIGIISKANFEYTTDLVILWLRHLGGQFQRINGEEFFDSLHLHADVDQLKQACSVLWFRRWIDKHYITSRLQHLATSNSNLIELEKHLSNEIKICSRHLWDALADKKWISFPPKELFHSKLKVLDAARKAGLLVPDTLITSQKEVLHAFLGKHKVVITKPISESIHLTGEAANYTLLTSEINQGDLERIPGIFFPSLFQEKIEKKYELRCFLWEEELHTMAIFSQKDARTAVDFRNYNRAKPNRTVPFTLPSEIHTQLIALANHLGLTTGSFDLIKDIDGNYIFLEVNPVGQFGMTSAPCNYQLEKLVAETLIRLDHEHTRH